MLVLGIESSCDDTSAALVEEGRLLALAVSSQDEVHAPFGGVVPEMASRAHLRNLPRVVRHVFRESGRELAELGGIAVTSGPGLVGCLLVGLMGAKGLAMARNLPFVGVNHLRAHLMANALVHEDFAPPFLGLVVSGGHSSIVDVNEAFRFELLGQTRDDAAGEVLDKVGRVLGLGYPAGRWVESEAREGDPSRCKLPQAMMLDGDSLEMSFSGLKTAAVQRWKKGDLSRADLCAGLQEAIVATFAEKVDRALKQTGRPCLALAGGVMANQALAGRLKAVAEAHGARCCVPPPKYCTDNAAMVAALGERLLREGKRSPFDLNAVASLGWRSPGEL